MKEFLEAIMCLFIIIATGNTILFASYWIIDFIKKDRGD